MKKKILSLFLCAVLTLGVFAAGAASPAVVEAATDAEFEAYMDEQGFPENYKPYLRQLHEQYPNWTFVAFDTGMKWSSAVKAERQTGGKNDHTKQLITNNAPDSFKCKCSSCYKNGKYIVQESPDFVSASEEAVAYYMNPLNFLNDLYIYQFETTLYDDSQTEAGIETILKGTWMYQSNISYKDASGKTQTIDETYASVIREAAKDSGMSAYYLASKIVQEVGASRPTAGGVSGTNSTYPGIYNYYSIGANSGALDGLAWASSGLSTSKSTPLYKTVAAGSRDKGKIVAKNTVTIRTAASETSAAVGTLSDGLYVYLDGESGDWYKVSYTLNGVAHNGYLQKKYVEKLTATTGSTTLVTIPTDTALTYKGVNGDFYSVSVTVSGKSYTGYVQRSAVTASYGRPWYTPERSIYYGASYIKKSFGDEQFTGYLQKFNVNPDSGSPHSHEYMANVQGAVTEAFKLYQTYRDNDALSAAKEFYIPVFDGTPNATDGPHSVTLYSAYGRVKTETVDLNVRSGPGTGYTRLTTLPNGTAVEITAKVGNGWYRISFTQNGRDYDGFVSDDYIQIVSTDKVEVSDRRGQIMVSGVPLKASASAGAATKVSLASGNQVYINGESGDWYKVSFTKGGLPYSGFVEKKYVKIVKGTPKDKGAVIAKSANVYTSTAANKVETTLDRELLVYIDGTAGDYYLVSFSWNGWHYGYVKKDYIRDASLPADYESVYSSHQALVMTDEVIVRDADGNPVTVLYEGNKVYINDATRTDGKYKVSFKQYGEPFDGYVGKQYFRIASGDPKDKGAVIAKSANVYTSTAANKVEIALDHDLLVYIDQEVGDYYLVSFSWNGWHYGYVKKDYIRDCSLPSDYTVTRDTHQATVMINEVIVRDAGGNPVTVLYKNNKVYINEVLDNGRYKVSFTQYGEPFEGYVGKQYFKVSSGEAKPTGEIIAASATVYTDAAMSDVESTLSQSLRVYVDADLGNSYLVSFSLKGVWHYGYIEKTQVSI